MREVHALVTNLEVKDVIFETDKQEFYNIRKILESHWQIYPRISTYPFILGVEEKTML